MSDKYLKYKNKYLTLKSIYGGGYIKDKNKICKTCNNELNQKKIIPEWYSSIISNWY
jgi:hypothetical protein